MAVDFDIALSFVDSIGDASTFKYFHGSNKVFSVCAWTRPMLNVSAGRDNALAGTLTSEGGSGYGFRFIVEQQSSDTGRLRMHIKAGSTIINSASDNFLVHNEWQWVCVTGDNTNCEFYHYLPSSNTFTHDTGSGTMSGSSTNDADRELNFSVLAAATVFQGAMEDVRIYSYQLSEEQCKHIAYSMGNDYIIPDPNASNAEGRWSFMGGPDGVNVSHGDTIYDISGTGNNGTVFINVSPPNWEDAPLKHF